jgi:cytochrome b
MRGGQSLYNLSEILQLRTIFGSIKHKNAIFQRFIPCFLNFIQILQERMMNKRDGKTRFDL